MQKGNKTKKKILSRLWIACVTRAAWNSRKPRDYPKTESLNFPLSIPLMSFFLSPIQMRPFFLYYSSFLENIMWHFPLSVLFGTDEKTRRSHQVTSCFKQKSFFLTSNDWDDPTTRDWNPYVLTCNTMSVDLLCTVERTYFFYLLPD